ncbi:MAG: NnrS family protein [bacterium]|nr:NnrS family protein [bacterium]
MKHVFFQKGFRPFFLLGGLLASGLIPWWALHYDAALTGEPGLEGIGWHSHEMIFGFTSAILAGFLLTAVENWTKRPTARGVLLAVLVGLWSVGRLVGVGGVTASIAAMAELSFLPVLTVVLAIPLILSKSSRNYQLLAVLPLLWLCDAHHHLRTSGLLPQSDLRSDLVAVDLVVVVMIIITGRIVPLFTRNTLDDESVRAIPSLNIAATVGAGLVVVAEVVAPNSMFMAVVAGIAGLLVLGRSFIWGFHRTLTQPILWVLHLGHAWIWIGLLLKGASAAGFMIPSSVGTHALTAGAIGTLTLGMMARVTLGHTGRKLQVSRLMTLGFVAIAASTLIRVLGPWFRADLTATMLTASATLWAVAFLIYVVVNAKVLVTPRPDGNPG